MMFIATTLSLGLYFSVQNDQRRWIALSAPEQQQVNPLFSPEFDGKTLFKDFSVREEKRPPK